MPEDAKIYPTAKAIIQRLAGLGDPAKAAHALRFFKTGPGEYGEGDVFRGIRVPPLRSLVKEIDFLPLPEVDVLLASKFHEDRLLAVYLLVRMFSRGKEADKKAIYSFYLAQSKRINGWDLVDSSAHLIVGPYLENRDRSVLTALARSPMLWDRRIAVLATFHFIRKNDFEDTLKLSALLLRDPEDLIHKAVGWMLREVGNRSREAEVAFLDAHYALMPRTMLRIAIEKFPPALRAYYLQG